MSVTNQTPYKQFTAAPGAALFSSDFRVILASDLVVRKDGVIQPSGFTVSGLGNPAGVDVTFGVPMVGGELIELSRQVPLTRLTDYQQSGDFLSPVVNIDFDRLWMALQDQQFLSNLAILLPVGDPLAPMSIPSVVDRANKFLAFDALGQAIAAAGAAGVPVSAFMSTLLDDLNAAAARATLGAAASGGVGASGLTLAAARFVARLTAGTGAPEELTGAQAQSLLPLNLARIDVASATMVNLTTSAPSTDHINITGTTTITGFTVAAGRLLFVRFAGAMQLTNSASLVTQRGANIVTAAGDTCVLRATAANTVEVLGYVTVPGAYGTPTRALNTLYTNTTSRYRWVQGYATNGGAGVVELQVDADPLHRFTGPTGSVELPFHGLVPPGSTYRLNTSGTVFLTKWKEVDL